MSIFTKRRLAAATAALAVVVSPLAGGALGATGGATPARSASTSVDTTYLSDTFPGLSASTILETVTYDRFQWLLQQPGQFAFLIGDAADAGFPAKVVQAEAAAKAAGAAKIYWFDPNLSGQTGVKNLDSRNPAVINLAAGSQTIFGNTWKNLLGQYLGNGIKSVPSASGTTVAVTADDTVVNDVDGPAWDYRSTATAAVGASDDVFFVYDKDRTGTGGAKDKIAAWVDLTSSAAVPTDVTAALTASGGASNLDQLSQFQWWKDAANKKHDLAYTDDARYGGDILGNADDEAGWRIKQITYPELLHLLELNGGATDANKNFVLLFGGTWCHNTRAVLKYVNADAQENDVKTVYNFDLVLDGGTTNGTNGSSNPIHVRDNANSGTTTNFRPSYLYGDVIRRYFRNLVTEYDPNGGTRVSYYPGGDLTAFPDVVRKLQVPFLINYQRGTGTNPSTTTSVQRQWIQQNIGSNGLPTFKEYMTEWWFTSKSPQLGLNFPIPADESTLTPDQATALEQARDNVAFAQEGLDRLDTFFGGLPGAVVTTQTVTAPPVTYGTAPKVNVAIANKYGRIPAGTATLTVAGKSYPVPVVQNAAAFTVGKLAAGSYPYTISYPGDADIVGFTKTGTLTVTKAKVSKIAGTVVKAPTSKKAGKYQVVVTAPTGLAKATGKVTVTLTKGKAHKTVVGTLGAGTITVTAPKLPKGTWKVAISYAGDAEYAAGAVAGKAVVVKK